MIVSSTTGYVTGDQSTPMNLIDFIFLSYGVSVIDVNFTSFRCTPVYTDGIICHICICKKVVTSFKIIKSVTVKGVIIEIGFEEKT